MRKLLRLVLDNNGVTTNNSTCHAFCSSGESTSDQVAAYKRRGHHFSSHERGFQQRCFMQQRLRAQVSRAPVPQKIQMAKFCSHIGLLCRCRVLVVGIRYHRVTWHGVAWIDRYVSCRFCIRSKAIVVHKSTGATIQSVERLVEQLGSN